MKNKIVIVTGASDGIGAAAARKFESLGAKVVIVGRSPQKTKKIGDELNVPYYVADFSKFADVRALAEKLKSAYPHIDVLANNAGAVMGKTRTTTVDGHETTVQVNHLSPFLLTNLLMDTLVSSKATIINTSSMANRFGGGLDIDDLDSTKKYSRFPVYGQAKLMNILFAKELQKRYGSKSIFAASFHPGVVRTNFSIETGGFSGMLYKTFLNGLLIPAEKGADTLVWLASTTPGIDWTAGEYYSKRKISKANTKAYDEQLAHDLWEKSLVLTGLR